MTSINSNHESAGRALEGLSQFHHKHRGINFALNYLWKNRHSNVAQNLSNAEKLEASCKLYQYPLGELNCQVLQGQLLVFMGQSEKALVLGRETLRQFSLHHLNTPSSRSVFELRAHNFLGAACMMNGDYAQCLDYWNQGIQIADELEDDPIIVNILHNLAELYRGILNNVERALELYENAIERAIQFELPIQYALEAGKALCHAMLNRETDAIETLHQLQSKNSFIENQLPQVLKLLYYQFVAHAYLECNEFVLALDYAQKGIETLGVDGDPFRQLNYKLIVARAYSGLHQPLKALETSQYFLDLELETKHDGLLMFIYKVMAQSFGEIGQWEHQAHYAKLCVEVTEREFKMRMDRQAGIAAAQFKQHLLKKDLEIHKLKNVALKEKTEALENTAAELSCTLNELLLTQQRLIESEKLAALGRVVSGVAHEINTPLGIACSSLSYLEHLLQEGLNEQSATACGETERILPLANLEDINEAIDLLDVNLKKVSTIVNRFKEISAKHFLHREDIFNLQELFIFCKQMVLTMNKAIYANHAVPPQIELDLVPLYETGYEVVNSYSSAWQDILIELLTNAILHNAENEQVLTVKVTFEWLATEKSQESLRLLRLTVEDNGVGIPDDFQTQLFEPFSRVAHHKDHMGLGLHSIHNLVIELLDGQIKLEKSIPGMTRFVVEAPVHY